MLARTGNLDTLLLLLLRRQDRRGSQDLEREWVESDFVTGERGGYGCQTTRIL